MFFALIASSSYTGCDNGAVAMEVEVGGALYSSILRKAIP